MRRETVSDLVAFIAIAREKSFTRAASSLGVSQSALSHTIKALETRLGLRLLTRTTRSVSTTAAGERLLRVAAPRLDEVQAEIDAINASLGNPSGTFRITAAEHSVNSVLVPKIRAMLVANPGIKVEISIDYGLRDIVADGFDAGVRLGEQVQLDMIAVRIGPDFGMAVVGSPDYFARNPAPRLPQDLTAHQCINLRLTTAGGLYAWEFEKAGRELRVSVDGPLIFNSSGPMKQAAIGGAGLAYVPEDMVRDEVRDGRLVRVLKDWCEPFSGYHLYFPQSRQTSRAFSILVEALRQRS